MGASGMTEGPKRQDKDARESEEDKFWEELVREEINWDKIIWDKINWDKINWDKIKGYFLDNPTLALTLLYLYVTAVGMLYSAVLYGRFGINIFDYSEIADFLLAAFKNPVSFLSPVILVAIGTAGVSVTEAWSRLLIRAAQEASQEAFEEMREGFEEIKEKVEEIKEKAKAKQRKRKVTIAIIVTVTIGFSSLVLPYYSASKAASGIKDGQSPAVDVLYRSFKGSAGQVTAPGLEPIGATQKAAF